MGKYFYALLMQKPDNAIPYKPQTDVLTVAITDSHFKVRGHYLDQDAVDDFNEFVYEEIVEGICNYITGLMRREGVKKYDRLYIKETIKNHRRKRQVQNPDVMQLFEIKEIIHDHLQRFEITENDLPIETIRKNVYRRMNVYVKAS